MGTMSRASRDRSLFIPRLFAMDLGRDATDLVSREFLAVVLAGFGNEYACQICRTIPLILSFSGYFR